MNRCSLVSGSWSQSQQAALASTIPCLRQRSVQCLFLMQCKPKEELHFQRCPGPPEINLWLCSGMGPWCNILYADFAEYSRVEVHRHSAAFVRCLVNKKFIFLGWELDFLDPWARATGPSVNMRLTRLLFVLVTIPLINSFTYTKQQKLCKLCLFLSFQFFMSQKCLRDVHEHK
jgi:hypothetical protein